MQRYEVEISEEGTIRWRQDGVIHRLDGPAMEFADGSKYWYYKGLFHRIGGPAVEHPDGYKSWHTHGKRDRLDGPAVVYSNGLVQYWIDGINYTEEEFIKKTTVRELTIAQISDILGYNVKIIKG